MNFKTLLVFGCLLFTAQTCNINLDSSALSANDAGDLTTVFVGYGQKTTGFLHVRVSEKAVPNGEIKIIVPALNCDRPSCNTVNLIRKDGNLVQLGAVPRNQVELKIALSDVIGHADEVEENDGGPYRVFIESYYKYDGQEYKIIGPGVIYITVLKEGYTPLTACKSADSGTWSKVAHNCVAEFTTKYRTVLCGKGCN